MKRVFEPIELNDQEPTEETFLSEVLAGLGHQPKTAPSKFLYDRRGSELFDQICELPEYYPTRTEIGIMRAYVSEMADLCGRGCLLFEYGSGSSTKTPILLDALDEPAAYAPIDISRDHLLAAAAVIADRYPKLKVVPICADFTTPFDLPDFTIASARPIVYFPGSTIGNFTTAKAADCLDSIAKLCTPDGGVLIGVDLIKDPAILRAAYNDAQGVTAAFNLNFLERVNRELGADFNVGAFRHEAIYNPEKTRIEMHLVSLTDQIVTIAGHSFHFARGETIHTENSHKHSLDSFREVAAAAGLDVRKVWTDADDLFSVQYLTRG